jgi:hypothetical protein
MGSLLRVFVSRTGFSLEGGGVTVCNNIEDEQGSIALVAQCLQARTILALLSAQRRLSISLPPALYRY